MLLKQFLVEKLVNSSWIRDIHYYGRQNKLFPGEEIITFKVKNNDKTYILRGANVTRKMYLDWAIRASSKGKYWHQYIKNAIDRTWFDYVNGKFIVLNWNKLK